MARSSPRPARARRSASKKTAAAVAPAAPAASLKFFKHPNALVESTDIGPRSRVWAFAHVMRGAVVGADCNVGECVYVEGGVRLGDHVTVKNGVQLWTGVHCEDWVFIGPNATFTNDLRPRVQHPLDPADFATTHVGTGASLGANCTIVAGIRIGAHAMIGAGTVVLRDVPAHALLVGNPARQIGWVCGCGKKLPRELRCTECGTLHKRSTFGLAQV